MSERMSVRRREVVMMLCFGDGWGGRGVGFVRFVLAKLTAFF